MFSDYLRHLFKKSFNELCLKLFLEHADVFKKDSNLKIGLQLFFLLQEIYY